MLQQAQSVRVIEQAPWLFIPAAFVVVAVLAFTVIGDGLRDAADPPYCGGALMLLDGAKNLSRQLSHRMKGRSTTGARRVTVTGRRPHAGAGGRIRLWQIRDHQRR